MTIDELEHKITAEQAMLAELEEALSFETHPRRRAELQTDIEKAKIFILGLQTQLAELLKADESADFASNTLPTTFIANAPYGLETGLVGREKERSILDSWFLQDPEHPFMAVIGLGGQGKSALTWDWLRRKREVGETPPLVVWWGFYETDGTLHNLMAEVLTYFGDDPRQFATLRSAVNRFLVHLQQNEVLLMLDGAERLLRAYSGLGAAYQGDGETRMTETARQCIDPVAGQLLQWLATPGYSRGKTLFTSRLFPQDLEGRSGRFMVGVRRQDLPGLTLEAAYQLFRKLGIGCTRAEVQGVAEPLGYHPLSLGLLAYRIADDPARPGDLRAAAGYDPTDDLLGKRQHVLAAAYGSLPETAQQMLSRLAAFRGGVDWQVVEAVLGGGGKVRRDLALLRKRGMLQQTTHRTGQGVLTLYDLHPIVRRYAYDRLNNPAAMHGQLVVYFEAVPKPEKVTTLADLQLTIELYHHLVRAGKYDEAFELFRDRLNLATYYQLGAYQTEIELMRGLFPDGEAQLPRLSSEGDQAWTLVALGNSYSLAGQPAAAVPLIQQQIEIREKQGDKRNLAVGLGNLADDQMKIGQLTAAAENLRRRITLCQEIENQFKEAAGHQQYGRLLAITGRWEEATPELDTSTAYWTETNNVQGLCVDWVYRAQAALLRGEGAAAVTAAQEAFRLAEETARTSYPVERDFIRAYWLLGWAAVTTQDLPTAQQHLDEALRRCRAINLVSNEPAILLAHARLAHARGEVGESKRWAEDGRQIAERAGYVLDLADIYNHLALLALEDDDLETAKAHAEQGRKYAWCDGPPYAYQAALDEAQRLLSEIGGGGAAGHNAAV